MRFDKSHCTLGTLLIYGPTRTDYREKSHDQYERPRTRIREQVCADFQEAGEEDVFRKLRADFDAAGVSISDEDIRQKMFAYLQDAVAEVKQ